MAGLVVYGLSNFALVFVLARGLGGNGAGAFLIAIAAFNIAVRTCTLGTELGLVRSISSSLALGRPGDARRVLRPALLPVGAVSVVVAAIGFVSAPSLARLIGSDGSTGALADYLRVLAIFVPVAAVYHALEGASRGFGTMRPSIVVEKTGKALAQLLLVAIAVGFDITGHWLAVLWCAPLAAALVVMAAWVARLMRRALARGPSDALSQVTAGAFWRFTAPRALAGTFQVVILWSDTVLVGALASTREAGVYASGTRYLLLGSFVQLAIGQASQPRINRLLTKDDRSAVRDLYQTATAWSVLATWPLLLTVAMFAPVLLDLLGRGFDDASTALLVLGLAWLVATGCGPVDSVLLMLGRSGWVTVNLALAVGLDVGLNVVLIPRYGITGAGISWSAAIVFLNLVPLAQLWKRYRLHPFGPAFPIAAGAAVLSFGLPALLVRTLIGTSTASMFATLVPATALYVALLAPARRRLALDVLTAQLAPRRGARTPLP